MYRYLFGVIALSAFIGASFSANSPSDPPGLRAAIAKHDDTQAQIRHRLYGSPIEQADPASYEFKYALVDLNGDGIPDAIVYFTGQEDCGTGGCRMQVYKGTNSGFDFVSGTLRVFPPILVLPASTHGWRSLAVALREGGSGVLSFNGQRYPLSPPDGHPASASELDGSMTLIEQ
jgi:hypothetical protein